MSRLAAFSLALCAAAAAHAAPTVSSRPLPPAGPPAARAVVVADAKALVAKGSAAVKHVQTVIHDADSLQKEIDKKDKGGNRTSCALTVGALQDLLGKGTKKVEQFKPTDDQKKRLGVITKLLTSPKAVFISVKKDHHFVVVPIDVDKVAILQGFQGTYDLVQWMANRGAGVMRKDLFLKELGEFVSGDKARRQAAALQLFSFKLAAGPKQDATLAKKVEKEVAEWFAATGVIEAVVSKDL